MVEIIIGLVVGMLLMFLILIPRLKFVHYHNLAEQEQKAKFEKELQEKEE